MSAQHHLGENIGDTPTLALFVELKRNGADPEAPAGLCPSTE